MYILFDIGGTKIRVASSDDGVTLSEPITYKTPEYFKEGVALLIKAIETLSKGKKIKVISGGVASAIDKKTGTLLRAPNLRGWEGNSLKDALSKYCQHIYIENDAALVGLGEAIRGAGRGFEIVAYVTVSTGIGGARVVNGKIDTRRVDFEPGQQIIDTENLSSLENRASGRAIEKKYRKEPKDITDDAVWKRAADDVAVGLHNTIVLWSPDVVVLGGPMMLKKPGIDLEEVKAYLKNIMYIFPTLPELKLAELGDNGGLYGALEYALQQ